MNDQLQKKVFTEENKEIIRRRIEILKHEREESAKAIEVERIRREKTRQTNRERYARNTREAASELNQIKINKRAEKKQRDAETKTRLEKVTAIIHKHSTVLYLKFCRCQHHDEYGISTLDKMAWDKDLNYFLLKVLPNEIEEYDYIELHIELVSEYFKEFINQVMIAMGAEQKPQEVEKLNGMEFEKLCSDILRSLGWHTSMTKGSGDQGIDIIATKENIVVVLQCKRYSGSVGNKAVQEVLGGKEMIKANFAAVVTNSTYTKSARQLAANSGVMLIHFDQLNRLDEYIVEERT